jgi:pilus assembly protein Flp/PilA
MNQLLELYCACRTRLVCLARTGEEGASLVEYALLVALIAVVCIAAVAGLGRAAASKFSSVGSSVR